MCPAVNVSAVSVDTSGAGDREKVSSYPTAFDRY